ncbi:MAG: polyphosphate kinase [Cyclobacteriaceae bacterium]|nr:MAG: polyphosphate kinase [Cyclobacteriaceae bacterium]
MAIKLLLITKQLPTDNKVNFATMTIPIDTEEYSFKDRDIDWLSFNERVLQEAADSRNPILERLKFLAIFSSNLDEFFKVRISKLRQIKKIKKRVRRPLGLRPNSQLKTLLSEIDQQQQRFGKIFREQILPDLEKQGIYLKSISTYSETDKEILKRFFSEHLEILDSITYNSNISSDSLKEGDLYVVAYDHVTDKVAFAQVPVQEFGRFIQIPSDDKAFYYTYLEDVIKLNSEMIFPGLESPSLYNIKISKDAELYLEDDYEGDWIELIYESLKKRQTGQPTRLLFETGMPKNLHKKLRKLLELGKIDMFQGGRRHNFSDFFSFPKPNDSESLVFKDLPPLKHKEFEQSHDFFELIARKDRLLHFPYQRFQYLENWLEQAAIDPSVTAIHISLYRIAKASRLTSALLKALQEGKEVTIFVEAKARFDEGNNIRWGRKFEDAGAKVYYSFPNVKVHSKILHIERLENKILKGYCYIGTGNFNAKTSEIYCDHGLFTANSKISGDLQQVFKVLQRGLLLPKLKLLLISPFNTRTTFENLIKREIEYAKANKPAHITAKMNSLEDKQMIAWLYKASNAGVKVDLLVRGFCCLIPGIKGQSENIKVISIVDRFLEHARVFLFHNNGKEEMFMGSADWMTRNLDKRIEVITPILDVDIFKELRHILHLQLNDTVKARIVDDKALNKYVKGKENEEPLRSQYEIYSFLKKKVDSLKIIMPEADN